MNVNKIGNITMTSRYFITLVVIACIWIFLIDDKQPPFLTVAIKETESSNQYQVSVCKEIKTIKENEILNFYNSCEGEVFIMDNLNNRLSEGIYLNGSFRSIVIFQKIKNKLFSAIVVYDLKY